MELQELNKPFKKNFEHMEIKKLGNKTLVRGFKWNQFICQNENGDKFCRTDISLLTFESSNNKKHSKKKELKYDSSDVHFKKSDKKKSNSFKNFVFFFLTTTLVGYLAYFFIIQQDIFCKNVWHLDNTVTDIKNLIFGQDDAVEKLNYVLNRINQTEGMSVVIFTGGVGVGKTYTALTINKNLPWTSKTIISKHSFELDQTILPKTYFECDHNLLIIEDLTVNDMDSVMNLIEFASYRKYKKLFIILIFTTHSNSEKKDILSSFSESHITYYHVPFKNLDKEAVRKCYLQEINKQKAEISEMELHGLISKKMRPIEIVKGPVGCKGVSDDVAFYTK